MQFVDTFIYEIGRDEKDLAKQLKTDSLWLVEEWTHVRLFNDLLAVHHQVNRTTVFDHFWIQHADNTQQAFLSDRATTLHLALPALEAPHKAWTKQADRSKYHDFVLALNAGLDKIEEYSRLRCLYFRNVLALCYIMFGKV